ncbi:MAG: hypothetical protein JWN04_1586 [Myxococcaceae bacterium]|nr:hypothetical protein [Myxococcaceae bacterium]
MNEASSASVSRGGADANRELARPDSGYREPVATGTTSNLDTPAPRRLVPELCAPCSGAVLTHLPGARARKGGFVMLSLGVVGALFLVVPWWVNEVEEKRIEDKYKGTLRTLWVRAQVNWETGFAALVMFSQGTAARLLAAFAVFGPLLSLRFAAASILLGCTALAMVSLLSVLVGSVSTLIGVMTATKVVAEVLLLLFYLRTSRVGLFAIFLVLCTFEIATPQYGAMTIGGAQLFLLKLSFFIPAYVLSLVYVPLSRLTLELARRSRWAPAIVPTVACVPFAAAWATFSWLLDGIETRSGPYSLGEIYGALAAAVSLFCLAVASVVNTVVLWRSLKAGSWNLAARTFESMHNKAPMQKILYWFGILLIGLSIASNPTAWLLKSIGLPEH